MGSPERDFYESETLAGASAAVRSPSTPSSSGSGETIVGTPSPAPSTALPSGTVLASRYEILQLLGEGGMGAVYKAHDRELDRTVALKTIRAEFAGSAAMLQRFKQEIILAREVTHRNVVRIYDISEDAGMKFITMEYVAGEDLQSLLRSRGKFPPAEAASTIRQVCEALDVAHKQGVIHRDLKPQNIMRDAQGRIVVMDFGLARTLGNDGMTQTGALVGTMAYMSPEQALGEKLDSRSDLFAVGLIFYELLTGKVPFAADSAVASLVKRSQQRAESASDIDPSVPVALSNIVARCLERDRNARYQTAADIIADVDRWTGGRQIVLPRPKSEGIPRRRLLIVAVILAVVVLTSVGVIFRQKLSSTRTATQAPIGPPLSIAVLPFRNASLDPQIDWLGTSIPEMLSSDIGQSAQLRTVPADRVHQILRDLRIPANYNFDPDTIKGLAGFSNADVVIYGQYVKIGEQIRIDAVLQDLKHQRSVPVKTEAANDKDLLAAMDRVAQAVRNNLALSSGAVQQLKSSSFKPTSSSMEALRSFNHALELRREGKDLDAVKEFEAATQQDPQFALAYSHLGETYDALGYDSQAQTAAHKALDLSRKLPDLERFLVEGSYARVTNDPKTAIDRYEKLLKAWPDDTDVLFTLGGLYENTGSFDSALDRYGKLLDHDPKNVRALLAMGRVDIKSGKPQDSLDPLNRAFSLAVRFNNDEQKAAILQALGIAYRGLDKPDDALRSYQQSLEIKQRLNDQRGIAASLSEIAQVFAMKGKQDAALATFQKALDVRRKIGDKAGIGNNLIDLGNLYQQRGRYDEALKLFNDSLQIETALGDTSNQALCLNNIGNVYFMKGAYSEALTSHQQALQLREQLKIPVDLAQSNYNLAETSMRIGQYDKALPYYLRALELWRGAGDNDGVATASYGMGALFDLQARFGAALNADTDALKMFKEAQNHAWSVEALSGYGHGLTMVGRFDEAQKSIDDALAQARQMKDSSVIAQTLNYQGDRFYYAGDYKAARPLYDQALREASRGSDRYFVLLIKLNVAKNAIASGAARSAIPSLNSLRQDANALQMKYIATNCALYLGEAYVATRDYPHAIAELQTALQAGQEMGLRSTILRAHYLMAQALTATGNTSEAASHQVEARNALQEIRTEAASDTILKRADLASIFSAVQSR